MCPPPPDSPHSETAYFKRSARLGFTLWNEDQLDHALKLWGDPAVTRLISINGFKEDEIKERLTTEIHYQKEHGFQYWPLFILENGDFAGCTGFHPVPGSTSTIELGYHLLPDYWGSGYAVEAAEAAIEHAFSTLGAEKIKAGHHPGNSASAAVLKKLGFELKGKELYPPTGLRHPTYFLDRALYLVSKSESN